MGWGVQLFDCNEMDIHFDITCPLNPMSHTDREQSFYSTTSHLLGPTIEEKQWIITYNLFYMQ